MDNKNIFSIFAKKKMSTILEIYLIGSLVAFIANTIYFVLSYVYNNKKTWMQFICASFVLGVFSWWGALMTIGAIIFTNWKK